MKAKFIVWRDSPNEPIRDYELLTVTYGTQNAPYLAIRVLRQLAEDILNDFYMDEMITGFHTEAEAIKMYRKL